MSKVIIFDLEAGLPIYKVTKKTSLFERGQSEVVLGSIDNELDKRQEELKQANIHHDIGSEEDSIPGWVKVTAKTGRFGEELAIAYLKEQSLGEVKYVGMNAKLGYDIQVSYEGQLHAYEIKTTTKDNNKFYISYNELRVAEKMQNLYHLLFIKINNIARTITGYHIVNPINMLDIDFHTISKLINNQKIELASNQFVININDNFLLSTFDDISLDAYVGRASVK
ncbi:DUF3883 domain-containing protein [Paenibacillus sp. NEAU-GSW1]|uniref:protein NO VEIN domain-containing protein n=1 Tax=Paenibacillus sp. NEAU-GSW1 TaxID=2682486 RepID=UPI0012E2E482|nr:DUF3883 domain-containing protein [Paenibacillus sp. NEAU-GSW1]MUT68503.1 DUF3883 domain-containing protein [Paenibacillus sp. NEAU-GSW1]